MILCRVLGNVVSTQKKECYDGKIVLVCQPVHADGVSKKGRAFIACDSVQAGPGDLVVVAREGNCARQGLGTVDDPFHAVILGGVDDLNLGE